MIYVLIAMGILSIILLFLLILQRREIKSISKQLQEISPQETNALVHSIGGGKAYEELINDINALLCEVQSSRIQYQQKKHALEQMLTNISHDLRTPLTSAMSYIEMVRNFDLSQEEKEREIEIVEKRLQRLEELIHSFFEFSKIISSDKKPEMEELNLTAVLEESIAHYYDDYQGQNREIHFHCDQPKMKLYSNLNMLMGIFDNLIGNAYKHGTGNLTISVCTADRIQISFQNELVESDIDINRVFDEFYTTDISRTKGNTGLGLAIVKQFTQMLGGKISADYNGTVFSVVIEL